MKHRCILSSLAFGLAIGYSAQAGVLAADSAENTPVVLEAMEIGAVKAHTGGLLLSGQAGGTVKGALIWSLTGHDETGRAEVPFVIEVDGEALLAGRGGRRIAVGIFVYVIDGEGRIVDHIAQGLVLDPAVYRDRIARSGLKFIGRFDLEPGDYTLRVMVQNNETGDYFMSWSILTLPKADEPAPLLLPPLFPDPDTPWVIVRQNGKGAAIALGGETEILPAALPVLVENQPAELFLGGGGWDPAALVEIRIINELGRTVSEPLAKFSGTPLGDFQFRRAVLTPIDLPPGEYSMIVTMADENAGEVLRRATRLTVVRDGELGGWAGVGDRYLTIEESGAADDLGNTQKVSKKEIRAAYREALRPLGNGDAVTARRMVAELERRATANASRSAVTAMSEAEFAESKVLAEANPICLMPLALLHRDLYRGYAARRELVLASHAREMAVAYADQLGRMKPDNGFSESLLVNLASDLAQAGSSRSARNLLERALRLNPEYSPALLSLGFSFESTSDYVEASTEYQILVNTLPNFDEGRLRLGINLIRAGQSGAGKKLLRGLLQNDARLWIQDLAAQELVRLLIRKGQGSEAEREARTALERFPNDQRLWILFAAILEQSDRHGEAVEVLADLPPASRGVSPRARYAEWPALGVEASQTRLTSQAAEAAPFLKAVLEAQGGAE